MQPLQASLFDSLDGVMYFFVSSGLFVLITAAFFFTLGLWIGLLTWGRFKKKFFAALETIEESKSELAALKRRAAEVAARPQPQQAPMPVQESSSSPLAALIKAASKPAPQPAVGPFSPGTAPGTPPPVARRALPASAAFTLWPTIESHVEVPGFGHTFATGAAETLQFTLNHAPAAKRATPQRSQAFCIWTEAAWKPHPPRQPPLPHSAAGSLWTGPDFVPLARGPLLRSQATSLWTAHDWSPHKVSAAPLPPARAHSLWTGPDFVPLARGPLLRSQATSLWTADDWSPPRISAAPAPRSRAFSSWTENGKEPAHPRKSTRNAQDKARDASQSALVAATASAVKSVASQAATPHPRVESPASSGAPLRSTPAPLLQEAQRVKGGIFARAISAAKAAFGIEIDTPSEPATPQQADEPPPAGRFSGFPESGAAKPAPGEWIESKAATVASAAAAFRRELDSGAARNDFLLGIVFNRPPAHCDDLSRLDRITPATCEALEAFGVHQYKQVAFWTDAQAAEFARRLSLPDGAVARRWIEQAGSLQRSAHAARA